MTDGDRTELTRLLARASDGDRRALGPLFALAWPVVRAFCRRMVGEVDADDAAQDAMVHVLARAPSFERERDGLTWVLTIAAWECRTVRRRIERRREDELGPGDVAATSARPDQLAERRELLAIAADVLGTLSPTDASTLVAAWTDDAAARAALAPTTFRKRLERALARFRSSWRSRHDVP